ncbi:hypothetical protein J6A31_04530 [bacterium]|nr:hypothetical protein [bacterium]
MTYILIACAIILFIIGSVYVNKYVNYDPKMKYLGITTVCWVASMLCVVITVVTVADARYDSNTSDINCSCECSCCQTCTDCNPDKADETQTIDIIQDES